MDADGAKQVSHDKGGVMSSLKTGCRKFSGTFTDNRGSCSLVLHPKQEVEELFGAAAFHNLIQVSLACLCIFLKV